jgi:hypothetical protein
MKYTVLPPSRGWWQVVCLEDDNLLHTSIVAMITTELNQGKMWADLIADQLNRGVKQ